MSPTLRLVHTIVLARSGPLNKSELQRMAREALDEHDRLRLRIAELERELKSVRRSVLYGMTDLA